MIRRFLEIPLTQRTIIICDAVFGLFSGLTLFYLPIYQEQFGLTSLQIGEINSIGTIFGFAATLFAGPIANKFSRRKVLLICDFVFWSIPILLWAFADSYAWFLIAASFNAAGRVGMGAYQGMLHEDISDNIRPRVVSYASTASTVFSAATPFTALFFTRYTLHGTLKTIFIIWFFIQTVRNIYRYLFTAESETGKKINAHYESISLWRTVAEFFHAVPGILRDRNKAMFCILFAISQFLVGLNFIHVLYLSSHILLTEGEYSLFPTITAITSLIAAAWIVPIVRSRSGIKMLQVFYWVYLAGIVMFIFLPKQKFVVFIVAAIILTGGSFLTQVFVNSAQMNYLKDNEKTMIYSLFQTVTAIFCIPAGYVGGMLFTFRPWLPYCLMGLLVVCSIILTAALTRRIIPVETREEHS